MSLFFASIRDSASRSYLRDENRAANLAGDIRQEYRSVQTGPNFQRRNINEEDSNGESACSVARHGCVSDGGVKPGEERRNGGAQDRALRRLEMDTDYQGMRPRAGSGRHEYGRRVCAANPLRRWDQDSC